jgi:homospermidine synthase
MTARLTSKSDLVVSQSRRMTKLGIECMSSATMAPNLKYCAFGGRLLIVGFGSIGQGTLPLILRHIEIDPSRITVVTAEERGHAEAEALGVRFLIEPLTRENYRNVLAPLIDAGDFLLNVSIDVSSVALIEFCLERGALYLDTCIEPWPGGYTDPSLSPSLRSNYALREQVLALRRQDDEPGPTALVTHGANPGLVSHFVKQALLNIARDTGVASVGTSATRDDWASLAHRLQIKVIHIAERDTQVANIPKPVGQFVNTWSIGGFCGEGRQPCELGWGTHERHFPADGDRHTFGRESAIYLNRPGASVRVRSWTPLAGTYHGFLITHAESISISDYLTVRENGKAIYRPTVHYAYHPCDDAVLSLHEFAGKEWQMQPSQRLMMEEIISGMDELGVLLCGHAKGAYWYGSRLSIEEARRLCPYNNATSLQVCVTVLAGMVWCIEHPKKGVVEPDDVDFRSILDICMPYLGPVVGAYSDWTPLSDRGLLFSEAVDKDDPWQFKNIRVS